MKNSELFSDLSATLAEPLFASTVYPWEILPRIKGFIRELGPTLPAEEYDHPSDEVWIAKDAKVYPTATIEGPAIIGHGTEVRPGAFIRGSALVGRSCVVGNSTELKNCILFDRVQAPHYNYIGDSILGFHAHLGAGVILSNFKAGGSNVTVHNGEEHIETGLRKFGAMLGDNADIGCNSVLCPGTVILPNTVVYPLSRVRGVVAAGRIYKDAAHIVEKK